MLGLVAVFAVFSTRPATPAEIVAAATTTTTEATATSTSTTRPFHYRIGVLAAPATDNFWAFYGGDSTVWDAYVLGPTKPALYGLDPVNSRLTPELAVDMPDPVHDTDGWHVDVELRSDLAWSDGVPITVEDLVFTFSTVRDLGLEGGWADAFPSDVATIYVLDAQTARIEFADRPSLVTWPHGVGTAPLMPAHVWEGQDASDASALYELSGEGDVGGGPLALSEIEKARVVSVANPGHPHPGPDRVEYLVYPDLDAAVGALASGEIDTVLSPNGLRPDHVAALADVPGVEIVHSPANGIRYLGFNLDRRPMSVLEFRQALSALVETSADSYIAADNAAWFDQDAADAISEARSSRSGLADAIAALEKAGYSWDVQPSLDGDRRIAGTGLRIDGAEAPILTILTPGDSFDPTRPGQAASVASVLQWLGFDARPVETDFQTVIDLAFTRDDEGQRRYDMALLGWTLGSPARPDFYEVFFSDGGEGNSTGYASEQFEAALARYRAAVDRDTAVAALWEMEAVLVDDLPYLLLSHTTLAEAYRADRVAYEIDSVPGGVQGRLGAVGDVRPAIVGATLGG